MVYKIREGFRIPASAAQAIGERMDVLKRRFGSKFTAAKVVDDGRNPNSPFHPHLEWNVTKAARLYNEEQARYLMRCYYVVTLDANGKEAQPLIANVSVADDEGNRSYMSTGDALRLHRERVFEDAINLLNGVKARLRNFEEAGPALELIAQAEAELAQARESKGKSAKSKSPKAQVGRPKVPQRKQRPPEARA